MKIKTLLVCFLAVALSLTSCKKENYAEKFVGTYDMTLSPELSFEIMGETNVIGSEEAVDGLTCVISQVGETQEVTLTIIDPELQETPVFILNGTCDETGMNLNSMTITESVADEEIGELTLDVVIGSSNVAEPVNGQISWESGITGTVSTSMMGMTVELELTGKMKFQGTKK